MTTHKDWVPRPVTKIRVQTLQPHGWGRGGVTISNSRGEGAIRHTGTQETRSDRSRQFTFTRVRGGGPQRTLRVYLWSFHSNTSGPVPEARDGDGIRGAGPPCTSRLLRVGEEP